jgi:hypothetical protein
VRPKTFTACGIEHGFSPHQFTSKHIAMNVLVPDFPHALWRETLTGEFEVL